MTDDGQQRARVALDLGYAITIGEHRKVLRLQAPDGRICLTISLSASGPAVEISAAALALATTGDVTIDCDRFSVKAQRDVSMVAGGNMAQIAGGTVSTHAGDAIESAAASQAHFAREGDVRIVANDDVALTGERIRLNDPDDLTAPPGPAPVVTSPHGLSRLHPAAALKALTAPLAAMEHPPADEPPAQRVADEDD